VKTRPEVRLSRMKREDLAGRLAQQSRVSRAQARDQVDEMVRKILKALREGQPVELPGVGRLVSKPPPRKGAKKK
jgi:nucleoid DNA-binding protein